ncbi:MAG: TatD DNase family protein [Verrucomicrobia bacterium]|nr:MAG: TatD DNase family protein [Verrucomicrobiota bacterium]
MNLYDAHAHLQDAELVPHYARVFSDLTAIGVKRVVTNGSSEADWPAVAALAAAQPLVLPSFGLHPWDAGNRSPAWQKHLLAHLDANPRAVIGEIGLDRWILTRAKPDDPRLTGLRRAPIEEQTEAFLWQFALAAERNLPAAIHCVDAHGLLHDLLRAAKLPARGFLLHSYGGSAELVTSFAKLGAYFSFNASFLDARRTRLREVYAAVPADRLLVETDAPSIRPPAAQEEFTLPATADGRHVNHPANLTATYAALADLRGTTVEALSAQVEKNFLRLFGS